MCRETHGAASSKSGPVTALPPNGLQALGLHLATHDLICSHRRLGPVAFVGPALFDPKMVRPVCQVLVTAFLLGDHGRRWGQRQAREAVHRLAAAAEVSDLAPHALRHSATTHLL